MKKNILIFITPKRLATNIPKYYKESFDNLVNKYNVQIYICYKKEDEINLDHWKKIELIKDWYIFQEYLSEENLLNFSKELKSVKNNIEVYTYREAFIDIMFKIKKSLWQEITEIKNIFISKKLQRENLLSFDKNITVNFLKFTDLSEINIDKVLKDFNFPFIIKPSSWISSAGVIKINSKKELENAICLLKDTFEEIIKISKIKNYEVIIEEFIDWNMYTIDYFVDQMWKIHKSKLVRTHTLKEEYNIEDFWITKEVLGTDIESEISEEKLNSYLEKCVKWCGVKNTFIHHEFKLTNSWELKTIELNWRIWWYRLEMYKKAYNLDLIEFLFNRNIKPEFKNNYTFIWLFQRQEIDKNLIWLDKDFINKFEKLDSFYSYMIKNEFIWNKIWFTKNWYKYFGTIRLLSNNFNKMEQDYNFIKKNLDKNIIYEK